MQENIKFSGAGWREGAVFVGLVALSRIILVVILGRMTRGREFADDVSMLVRMAQQPFDPFLGLTFTDMTGSHGLYPSNYPPLIGLLEAVFGGPLSLFLPTFYAFRLSVAGYETLTALFLWLILSATVASSATRRWAEAAFIVLPMGWLTVAMAHNTAIPAFLLTAVLWLVVRKRFNAALALCGLGLVAGKVFFAVPMLALIILLPEGRLWTRAAIASAPAVAVYGWVTLAALLRGNGAPLVGFIPGAYFAVTFWVVLSPWFHLTPDVCRRWSGALALAGGTAPLLPFVVNWKQAPPVLSTRRMAALIGSMLLAVFTLFYHVNADYYEMVFPILLLAFYGVKELIPVALLATAPWAVHFFYGVEVAMSPAGASWARTVGTAGGKSTFVRLYNQFCPLDPRLMFYLSLAACVIISVWTALEAFAIARRPEGDPADIPRRVPTGASIQTADRLRGSRVLPGIRERSNAQNF